MIADSLTGDDDPRIEDDFRGIKRVEGCFSVIMAKGEIIKCGQTVTLSSKCRHRDQPNVAQTVYFSDVHRDSFLMPTDIKERKKFMVGKPLSVELPDWFDREKGDIVEKYTFADEEELQILITLKTDGHEDLEIPLEPLSYEIE